MIPEKFKNHKLCYVEGDKAYFTNLSLDEQWGDDWDDAPYEHNAGIPYSDSEDQIYTLFFDADISQPSSYFSNSPFSVKAINNGAVAWLSSWDKETNILAGTTVEEFVSKIRNIGGQIYVRYE